MLDVGLGFVGGDDPPTHQRQLADPDCLYLLIEVDGSPAGYAILRGLSAVNGSVELKRIVIAEFGWQADGMQMQWSLPGMMKELK